VHDKDGNVGSHLTNVSRDLLKFGLKWCNFGLNVQEFFNLSDTGVFADHDAENLALTISNGGT